MKIVIKTGELDLSEDFSFEIEKTSSVYSEQGEQSIPVTLPATPHNLALLGQPLRPARHTRYPFRIPARLEAGVFGKTGELVISKYSRKGISASFIFSESVIYSEYSEKKLKDLFKDCVRTDFSTPWEWAGYLIKVYNGAEQDEDFTIFPVLTEKNEDAYLVLNEPDPGAEEISPALIYGARLINVGGEDEKVPEGYGLTPFLYLRRTVSMIFTLMGYTIGDNAFDEEFFDNVVLVNNNADSICDGTLHYADLVPSCTVADWLEWMEQKFGIYMTVRSDGKTVDLVALRDIYDRYPDLGISGLISGEDPEISVAEPSHLVIKSGTSIDGAAPAAETWAELVERYGTCLRLDDRDFMRWKAILPPTLRVGTLIYRLSCGEFYETQTDEEDTLTIRRIGTDYFSRDGKSTDNPEERSAQDELPPLYDCVCGVKEDGDIVTALYIGCRLHSRTSVLGQSESGDGQKIIIAADAGMTAVSYGHAIRYRFGTVRGCDNQGNIKEDVPDLRPEALYSRFFTRADYVARNCTASVKLNPHLPVRTLLSYDMLRPKWWKGALLLPKTLNYTVDNRYKCGVCEYQLLQEYTDAIPDTVPPDLPDLQFIWEYRTGEQSVVQEWLDNYEHPYGDPDSLERYWWAWDENPRSDFLWMPYPDISGEKEHLHKRKGRIYYFDKYLGATEMVLGLEADCWYESVPFDM